MCIVGRRRRLTVASSAVQANPTVNYNIQVFGGQAGPFANNFNVFGAPTADPQKYLHNGFLVDPSAFGDWRIDYNTTSDPDPSVGSASLSSGLTIQNRMADIGPGVNHLARDDAGRRRRRRPRVLRLLLRRWPLTSLDRDDG